MHTRLHIPIVALVLVGLAWAGYAFMVHRYGDTPIDAEVFIAKMYPIRQLDRMEESARRSIVAEMGRQLRRVPAAQRGEALESPVFREFYYESCQRADRIIFISYFLDEPARAVFQEFVSLSDQDRVRLIRDGVRRMVDDPQFRRSLTEAQWRMVESVAGNDAWLTWMARNYDVFLFRQLPMGQDVSPLITRLLDQLRGP